MGRRKKCNQAFVSPDGKEVCFHDGPHTFHSKFFSGLGKKKRR